MSTEKRLDRVVRALEPRQRAAMYLREYKAGLDPDPNMATFDTEAERQEFWRLVRIVDFCNDDLAQVVLLVREQVIQDALRVNWLKTVRAYAGALDVCARFLGDVREPVTASETRTRREPKRGFDVYRDDQRQVVERRRQDRRFVNDMVGCLGAFDLPLGVDGRGETMAGAASGVPQIVRGHLSVHWTELRAVDAVAGQYAHEFGEDVLEPSLRGCLDGLLEEIMRLRDDLVPFVGEWQLPDDCQEGVALLQGLARRALA